MAHRLGLRGDDWFSEFDSIAKRIMLILFLVAYEKRALCQIILQCDYFYSNSLKELVHMHALIGTNLA